MNYLPQALYCFNRGKKFSTDFAGGELDEVFFKIGSTMLWEFFYNSPTQGLQILFKFSQIIGRNNSLQQFAKRAVLKVLVSHPWRRLLKTCYLQTCKSGLVDMTTQDRPGTCISLCYQQDFEESCMFSCLSGIADCG